MKREPLVRAGLLLVPLLSAAALLSACDSPVDSCGGNAVRVAACSMSPEWTDMRATVLAFEGDAEPVPGSIGTAPIDAEALRGWNPVTAGGAYPPDEAIVPVPAASGSASGKAYVAASGNTGCRVATDATLLRAGDELRVEFTGGVDRPECVRAYTAYAQFEVDASAIAGARVVNGTPAVLPEGPGRLEALVDLTGLGPQGFAPVHLKDGAEELRRALLAAGAPDTDALRDALAVDVPAGRTGMAFVLNGCDEKSAVLLISPEKITARLTGGTADCESRVPLLAVFTADDRTLPPGAPLKQG